MIEFPRMVYHPDGRTATVTNKIDYDDHTSQGFGNDPGDAHRRPQATPVGHTVRASGYEELAMSVAATVVELMAERFDLTPKGTVAQAAAPLNLRAPEGAPKPVRKDA